MSCLTTNDYLQRIFERLDRDRDGYVSSRELSHVLQDIGISLAHDDLESLMSKTSLDFIDFVLFYEALLAQDQVDGVDEEKDLLKAFKVFDANGDGVITANELGNVLSRLGMWSEHCGGDCESMIRTYDANSDGVLDFQEFKKMLHAKTLN